MTRGNPGARHRPLVLVSTPAFCAVCQDRRVVQLVALDGYRGGGPVACPHCSASPRHTPIPIYLYEPYRDVPRGGAA